MLSIKVTIDKAKKIKQILGNTGGDYLDLLLTRDGVYLSSSTLDTFTSYKLEVVSTYSLDGLEVIRIRKDDFLALLEDGTVTFSITNSIVSIKYYDDKNNYLYGSKTTRINEMKQSIVGNLEKMFKSGGEDNKIDIKECGLLARVAKSLSTYIYFNNGKAIIVVPGVTVYSNTSIKGTFSVTGSSLDFLHKQGGDITFVEDSLIMSKDEVTVILQTLSKTHPNDIEYIEKLKAMAIAKMSFSNILDMDAKLKRKEGKFLINFSDNSIYLEEKGRSYTAELAIDNIRFTKGYSSIGDIIDNTKTEENRFISSNISLGNIEEETSTTDLFSDNTSPIDILDSFNLDSLDMNEEYTGITEEMSTNYSGVIRNSILEVPYIVLRKILAPLKMKQMLQVKFTKDNCVIKSLGIYIVFRKEVINGEN